MSIKQTRPAATPLGQRIAERIGWASSKSGSSDLLGLVILVSVGSNPSSDSKAQPPDLGLRDPALDLVYPRFAA